MTQTQNSDFQARTVAELYELALSGEGLQRLYRIAAIGEEKGQSLPLSFWVSLACEEGLALMECQHQEAQAEAEAHAAAAAEATRVEQGVVEE